MGRWLRKDPERRYFRHTDVLAARPDMVEVSEEEALGNQEQPAQEQQAPAEEASAGEAEGQSEADYIDGLDQEGLDAYAEEQVGQRPKHNLSLENQKLWLKQMLGLEE